MVARKSDCTVFKNVTGKVKTGTTWVEYRSADVLVVNKVEECDEYIMDMTRSAK